MDTDKESVAELGKIMPLACVSGTTVSCIPAGLVVIYTKDGGQQNLFIQLPWKSVEPGGACMHDLSSVECIEAIGEARIFDARVNGGAFFLKIEHYGHFVCTAIHNGHRMRPDIAEKCAWSEEQRLYEEDPFTANVISRMPITVVGGDSRFEYDLNRDPRQCIHETAWGRKVWKTPLSEKQRRVSEAKHAAFYAVLEALYGKLAELHPCVVIYSVHAYNYRRPGMGDTPLFNVGTEQLDTRRWQPDIDNWVRMLEAIQLPQVDVRVAINEVFFGRGYHATFTITRFPNILPLPTEIKKAYMDELTGQPMMEILAPLHDAFEAAILRHSTAFQERHHPGKN